MHAVDADQKPGELPWRWLAARDAPPARVGQLGTIAQCEPGDVVAAESPDGLRHVWALIAFRLEAGTDLRDAFAYVYSVAEGRLVQRGDMLRVLPSTMRIRWVGVRPAFERRKR